MASKGAITAHIFHERVIKESAEDNFFMRLLSTFTPYFFSHLHDVVLTTLPKGDLVIHFYEFFKHLTFNYTGEDIAHCYAEYYVDHAKKEQMDENGQ